MDIYLYLEPSRRGHGKVLNAIWYFQFCYCVFFFFPSSFFFFYPLIVKWDLLMSGLPYPPVRLSLTATGLALVESLINSRARLHLQTEIRRFCLYTASGGIVTTVKSHARFVETTP